MAQMDIEQLSPDLPLKPLYVIHGEEDLLRVEALDVLRQAARQQGYLNREVYSADSASFDWQELLHAAGSMGLFADLKLLEIHIPGGKPGKAGGDALQELAGRLPEDTAVVLMLPKLERAQMQAKWFAVLAKHGVVLEAKAVSGAALPQWIQGRLKQAGLEIEADALSLFAERVEGNLLAAKQEIDKLALENEIIKAKQNGKKYFIAVANMGTTMFGSVDNPDDYISILEKHNLEYKLHIDGAYGGFVYPFSNQKSTINFNNPKISSITIDAHKMLQSPYGTGVFVPAINSPITDSCRFQFPLLSASLWETICECL